MIAPPRPPQQDQPEALIPEARERHRRRQLLAVAGIAVAAGLGLALYALLGGFGAARTAGKPGGSAGVPACRPAQLSALPIAFSLIPGDTADVGGLDFRNVGSAACSLPGAPRVSVYLHGRRVPVRQLPANRSLPNSRGPRVHVLAPGKHAFVVFRYWCRSPNFDTRATLRYDFGGGLVLTQKAALPACGAPSIVRVAGPLAG